MKYPARHLSFFSVKPKLFAVFVISVFFAVPALAQVPKFWDPGQQIIEPDLAGLQRMRFLTSLDYPPFNFADENKKPTGFNVDLIRAICEALNIVARCEIQAMPWDELDPALQNQRAEAIAAGTAINAQNRARYLLSNVYFKFAGRMIARVGSDGMPVSDNLRLADSVANGKIAVIEGSAHLALLKTYFPDARIETFSDNASAYEALKSGLVDQLFGDAVSLSFWLAATKSENCCAFSSRPFFSDVFFGNGMAIAVRQDEATILRAVNVALKNIEANGVYDEIFARYFPINPFAVTAE